MKVTRRNFCVGGVGALAATVAGAAAKTSRAGRVDAIVLGAGISGLNTALLLEQQGLKVLVLEGRQRVGGRIFTLLDQPGCPEMGFASMGAGYARGLDAARKLGLELIDVGPRFVHGFKQELVLQQRLVSREEWAGSSANPFPDAHKNVMPWELSGKVLAERNPLRDPADWLDPANASLDVSMHDFLAAQGLSEAAIKMAYDTSPYFGLSSRDVSALMLEFNDAWVKSQRAFGPQSYMIKGGNQRLPMAMASRLQGELLLGKEVIGIESAGDGVSVACADGSRHRAARVVCSLPFATLRRVKITPSLTGAQGEALRSLSYQPISMAFITAKTPFWESDGHAPSMWTDGPLGTVMAQQFGPQEDVVTGLVLQARSGLARRWDSLGKEATARMLVAELEAVRPAARGQVRVAALHSWELERYNAGDWAYYGPGQVSSFLKTLSVAAGRLHFCGEHTAVSNRGIEGALESSERAALEVLSA